MIPFQTDDRVESPIYDPYIVGEASQQTPIVSPAGSVPTRGRARRQGWVLLIALSSLISTLAAVAILGWGFYKFRHLLDGQTSDQADDESAKTQQTGHQPDEDGDAEASKSTTATADDGPTASVPDDTKVERRGKLEVVDIGISSRGLKETLAEQSSLASARGQRVMLMTVGRECKPCRGVDASLEDPRMQVALSGIRLVRVDLKAFKEELAALKMPINLYPAFFLLGSDMTPLDGIHGGEWDADIPENIAPVLHKFVRGEYGERRHDWSPTTGGVSI